MADHLSKTARSRNMSRIGSKNTKPEILVRNALYKRGFRYRLHVKNLPGKPDIVLPKYKTVVFVNGCFWHGHVGCKKAALPETRTEWWKEKISNNTKNDQRAIQALESLGWRVIILWQCEMKTNWEEALIKNLTADLNTAQGVV